MKSSPPWQGMLCVRPALNVPFMAGRQISFCEVRNSSLPWVIPEITKFGSSPSSSFACCLAPLLLAPFSVSRSVFCTGRWDKKLEFPSERGTLAFSQQNLGTPGCQQWVLEGKGSIFQMSLAYKVLFFAKHTPFWLPLIAAFLGSQKN